MQIKLYGNGHSCNIPVQEIIDKYWKDETAPFSFEMSTAIGDETIAATAMLGEVILGLPKSLTFLVTMMMIPSVWSTLIMTSLKRWT